MIIKKVVVVLIMALLSVGFVSAIGLRTTDFHSMVDFEPNKVYEIDYWLVTNSGFTQDYEVSISNEGEFDLAQYTSLIPEEFKQIESGLAFPFKVKISLPENIELPGVHSIRVSASETQTLSQGGIGSKTAAYDTIGVRVLYPGKTARASIQAEDINLGEDLEVHVSVNNWGREYIEEAKAKIIVYEGDRLVKEFWSDSKGVESGGSVELIATHSSSGLKSGSYNVKAVVYYDGEEVETGMASFRVGELIVKIVSFPTTLYAGMINEFDVVVESFWNNPIKDVFVTVEVGDDKAVSPTTSLEPWESKTLSTYVNARNFEIGSKDLVITAHYADKTTIEESQIDIVDKPADVEEPSVVQFSLTTALLTVIIIIVLLDLAVLFSRRKRR